MIYFKQMVYFSLLLPLVFTTACSKNQISAVEREDLFTLEIGPMEDQIALYNLEGTKGIRRNGFSMRDGLIYVADGSSGKVVRFNSYGDLLFMIYNEENNPAPFSLRTNVSQQEQATRWAYSYPLEEPGWITVDSRKHIYAEDRLPAHARRADIENNVTLDGIILHFDQDGRFINYLGREGIGGSPFPRIIGLAASQRDEIAVICRITSGWDVYWFNSSGALLYLIKIYSDIVPVHPEWPQALAVIDSIAASPDSRNLYIKTNYFRDTFDLSTNTRTGSEPVSSVIWVLNIEDGSYSNSIEIPFYEINVGEQSSSIKVFYSLLGVSRNGKALLYFPVETGYSLLSVDINSRQHRRGNIYFTNDEIKYNDFFLSQEGILCAMLADDHNVKIVSWRTDRFIGEAP